MAKLQDIIPPNVLSSISQIEASPYASRSEGSIRKMFDDLLPRYEQAQREVNQAEPNTFAQIWGGHQGITGKNIQSVAGFDEGELVRATNAHQAAQWMRAQGIDPSELSADELRQAVDVAFRSQEAQRRDGGPLGFMTKPEFAIPTILSAGTAGVGLGAMDAGKNAVLGSLGKSIAGGAVRNTIFGNNGNNLPTSNTTRAGGDRPGGQPGTQSGQPPNQAVKDILSQLEEIKVAAERREPPQGMGDARMGQIRDIINQSLSPLQEFDLSSLPSKKDLSQFDKERISQIEQLVNESLSPLQEIDLSSLPSKKDLSKFNQERVSQIEQLVNKGLGGLGDTLEQIKVNTQPRELPSLGDDRLGEIAEIAEQSLQGGLGGLGGGTIENIFDILSHPGARAAGAGLLEFFKTGRQQDLLNTQFDRLEGILGDQQQAVLNNPFTKRALNFYDTFGEGNELPQRYKTILDFVQKGSERRGVARHGGTSQMSGRTAGIMSDAVSRTAANMFDRELGTLISGIGPTTALPAAALSQMPTILSGLTQAEDRKSDAIGTGVQGSIGLISDLLFNS